MGTELAKKMRTRCQQQGWYGPDDLRREAVEPEKSRLHHDFAFPPATETQLQRTEVLLGFSLPPLLRSLYSELANGGFGPGLGLRGAREGYGTIGTPLANGYRWLGDETLVKYRLRESLVDLAQFTNQWQPQGGSRVLRLSCNIWPRQLFPICDLGDDVEVCLDSDGHLYRYASSEENGIYTFRDTSASFEQWLYEWLES